MSRFGIITCLFVVALIIVMLTNSQYDISGWWYGLPALMYASIVFYGVITPSSSFFVPVKYRGSSENAIAITFDDGPLEGKTERLLDILNEHNVPAAFFCIGDRILKHPSLTKQLHDDGHLVSNHSFSHANTFDLQSTSAMTDELRRTDAAVYALLGVRPRFFRPPYGVINPNLASAIREGNYVTVGWSIRSFDTVMKSKDKLLRRISKNLKGGDIVLFHDYCDVTLEALPEFLDHVSKVGLKIVRLDELINERPYV